MILAFPAPPGPASAAPRPVRRCTATAAGAGLIATVPSSAHSGRIMVLLSHGRYTSSYGPIFVFRHALHPPAPQESRLPPGTGAASGTAFDGQGMWIWYLSQSDGGNIASIVAQAHAAGVSTLFVKSSDGSSNYWSQFSPQLVQELHANGLRVCAWQYVYGSNPAGEAELGARAVANGADCLVIDAEAEYEGRYAAAQTYITDLRAKVGPAIPLGLASFPYVSYHPSFPYSVFLGPNGAQYNAAADVLEGHRHLGRHRLRQYLHRQPHLRPPDLPARTDLRRGPRLATSALPRGGRRLRRHRPVLLGLAGDPRERLEHPGRAACAAHERDAEHHLPGTHRRAARAIRCCGCRSTWRAPIPAQETTGDFGSQTAADLSGFQTAHGIPPSGVTDAATWAALLALPPVAVDWTGRTEG